MFRWLKKLVGRPDRPHDRTESAAETVDEIAFDESDDLNQQAELAEAVKAKAAFAAMLTDDANDRRHYERLRDEALGLLQTINNAFYAGYARHQIIRLCLSGGESDRAAALLAEVEDEFILDDIQDEFPDLMPAATLPPSASMRRDQ